VTCCPYCETPIPAEVPECPACLLSFPRTCALVGALPRLNPVVADTTGQLKGALAGKMRKAIQRMQRRFPQLVVQLVMHRFPVEHPFSMHAFWLFNAGAFAGEGKRGKDNHALLILIDPFRQESAIVPGYGLEPLLQQEALDHLLEMSGPAFQAAQWQVGLEILLHGLERLLESVSVPQEGIEYAENDF
jgi:uncharacterized membrane protein YgcG